MVGQGRGVHLLNWETCCMPTKYGGLDLPNLSIRNTSLLLRWWWKLYSDRTSLWTIIASSLRGINSHAGLAVWMSNGSIFWNQLIKIKALFHWCAVWTVGEGVQVSYWYDSWGLSPIRSFKDGLQRPIKQCISLKEMLTRWPFVLSHSMDDFPHLNNSSDILYWRWSGNGQYTSASIYSILLIGGREQWKHAQLWRTFAPSKVKFLLVCCFMTRYYA